MHLIKKWHGPQGVLNLLSQKNERWWKDFACFKYIKEELKVFTCVFFWYAYGVLTVTHVRTYTCHNYTPESVPPGARLVTHIHTHAWTHTHTHTYIHIYIHVYLDTVLFLV